MVCPPCIPSSAQSARFLWCTVSEAFEPGDLSVGDIGTEAVSKAVLAANGFEIVSVRWFNEELKFKDKAGNVHGTLMAIRVWEHATIYPRTAKTISSDRLALPSTWDAFTPNKDGVDEKLAGFLTRKALAPIG